MRRTRAKRIVPIFNLAACLLFLYVLLPVVQDSGLRLFPEASSDAVTGLIGSYRFRLAGRFAIRFLTLSLAI